MAGWCSIYPNPPPLLLDQLGRKWKKWVHSFPWSGTFFSPYHAKETQLLVAPIRNQWKACFLKGQKIKTIIGMGLKLSPELRKPAELGDNCLCAHNFLFLFRQNRESWSFINIKYCIVYLTFLLLYKLLIINNKRTTIWTRSVSNNPDTWTHARLSEDRLLAHQPADVCLRSWSRNPEIVCRGKWVKCWPRCK